MKTQSDNTSVSQSKYNYADENGMYDYDAALACLTLPHRVKNALARLQASNAIYSYFYSYPLLQTKNRLMHTTTDQAFDQAKKALDLFMPGQEDKPYDLQPPHLFTRPLGGEEFLLYLTWLNNFVLFLSNVQEETPYEPEFLLYKSNYNYAKLPKRIRKLFSRGQSGYIYNKYEQKYRLKCRSTADKKRVDILTKKLLGTVKELRNILKEIQIWRDKSLARVPLLDMLKIQELERNFQQLAQIVEIIPTKDKFAVEREEYENLRKHKNFILDRYDYYKSSKEKAENDIASYERKIRDCEEDIKQSRERALEYINELFSHTY